MCEDIKQMITDFWHEHPGKAMGILIGFLLGCSVLLFGFWEILFVAVCAVGGLYVGTKFDKGNDVLHQLSRVLPEKFQRW